MRRRRPEARRVVERGEHVGPVGTVERRVPRLERDGLVSIHLDPDPAGEHVDELLPFVLRHLSRVTARLELRNQRQHPALAVRCQERDVDPFARRRDVTALVRPDDDRVAPRAGRQQVADVDVVEGGELHQPAEGDVALVVLDERQKRGGDARGGGNLLQRETPISPLRAQCGAEAAPVFHLSHGRRTAGRRKPRRPASTHRTT